MGQTYAPGGPPTLCVCHGQSAPTRYLMTTLIFFARSGRFLSAELPKGRTRCVFDAYWLTIFIRLYDAQRSSVGGRWALP